VHNSSRNKKQTENELLLLQFGETKIAWTCLNLYFGTSPPSDQYLCRAYVCQALLTVPQAANDMVSILTHLLCNDYQTFWHHSCLYYNTYDVRALSCSRVCNDVMIHVGIKMNLDQQVSTLCTFIMALLHCKICIVLKCFWVCFNCVLCTQLCTLFIGWPEKLSDL